MFVGSEIPGMAGQVCEADWQTAQAYLMGTLGMSAEQIGQLSPEELTSAMGEWAQATREQGTEK